jgi:hypothetical protein
MTQRDFLRRALELAEEHPEAVIHVLVANDQLLDDGMYCWTAHTITRVELGWWWFDGGEQFYTEAAEVQEILEEWWERDVTLEEAYGQMIRAVLIYTNAG